MGGFRGSPGLDLNGRPLAPRPRSFPRALDPEWNIFGPHLEGVMGVTLLHGWLAVILFEQREYHVVTDLDPHSVVRA